MYEVTLTPQGVENMNVSLDSACKTSGREDERELQSGPAK